MAMSAETMRRFDPYLKEDRCDLDPFVELEAFTTQFQAELGGSDWQPSPDK